MPRRAAVLAVAASALALVSTPGLARAAGSDLAAPVATATLQQRMVAAWRSGDTVRLDRAADALGAERLTAALRHRDANVRAAAIVAAPRLEVGALLLGSLARRASVERAQPYVLAALGGIRRIAEAMRPASMRALGLQPRSLAPVLSKLRAFASDAKRPAKARAVALAALAQLCEVLARAGGDAAAAARAEQARLAPLLAKSAPPAVRRAAVELYVGASAAEPAVLRALAMLAGGDPDARVARAAAAALCSRLPRYAWRRRRARRWSRWRRARARRSRRWRAAERARKRGRTSPRRRRRRGAAGPAPQAPELPPALAALAAAPGALARLSTLASSASTSRDRRVELARCLRWLSRAGDRSARSALRRLRRLRWLRRALWRVR